MKCPWKMITRAYADYSASDVVGKPINIVEQEFGECIEHECPFYTVKEISRECQGVEICTRALKEITND